MNTTTSASKLIQGLQRSSRCEYRYREQDTQINEYVQNATAIALRDRNLLAEDHGESLQCPESRGFPKATSCAPKNSRIRMLMLMLIKHT